MSFEDWERLGFSLQRANRAIHWWIGDWLRFGECKYGEKYAQALDETPFVQGTLQNDVWVAKHIEISRRRENLSFNHHSEVAKFEPEEQDYWLDLAEQNGWTQKKLRAAIKGGRNDKARKTPALLGQFDVDIRIGDFREVLSDLEDQSVKLILTDPPYGKEYLPLWEDLAVFASRVLRPDGALIAYSGQFYLPEVMAMLSSHLQWWWLCGVAHRGPGNLTPLGQPVRKVINQFKPLLMFVLQNSTGLDVVFGDLIEGCGSEKEKHNWQQPVSEAMAILETFCEAGDLVVDPFAGSGAFGEAARQLGLPFVGAEILTVSE